VLFVLLFPSKEVSADIKTPAEIEDYIIYLAEHEGINVGTALSIANCESGFDGHAIGDHGTSLGVFQIHLPAHPEVTSEQALNPIWNVDWAFDQMLAGKFGIWSCYDENT
jgi:hypothetical protein